MHVFLDSNIFFKKWFLESSQLRLVFHYLNNECETLFLSELVVEEVDNKYRSLAAKTLSDLEREVANLRAFYPSLSVGLPVMDELPHYSLRSKLKEKVDSLSIVNYDDIPQSVVVGRAIASKRPFQEGEKGYRDTLIWLSFLRHLEKFEIDGDVAFITANAKDFMGSGKGVFHPDLQEDLAAAGLTCRVQAFSSLNDFISENVNAVDHLIDESKVEALVEGYLEDEGVNYLENMSHSHLLELEEHLFGGSRVLANSSPITAHIVEGMEDLDLEATRDMGEGNVFIASTYELRMIELDFDITLHDYEVHKDSINKSEFVFDVSIGGGVVTIMSLVRPVYEVSFVYNVETEQCDGYYVDGLSFRRSNRSRLSAAKRGVAC